MRHSDGFKGIIVLIIAVIVLAVFTVIYENRNGIILPADSIIVQQDDLGKHIYAKVGEIIKLDLDNQWDWKLGPFDHNVLESGPRDKGEMRGYGSIPVLRAMSPGTTTISAVAHGTGMIPIEMGFRVTVTVLP